MSLPFTMKINKLFSSIVLALSSTWLPAQSLTPELQNLLTHTLDSMLTEVGCKSLSASVAFPNDELWKHANGVSTLIPLEMVTTDDAYLIGSITKTMTAACVLQLHDEGALHLDDQLDAWLPNYPYIDSTITIRELLAHRSGLYDFLGHPSCQPALLTNTSQLWTAEELLTSFMNPPLFEHGEGWNYCNTNYLLLGELIRVSTGHAYYTELRNRFFDPLSLSTVAIPAYETLTSPVAQVWMDLNGDGNTEAAGSFYMNWLSLNAAAGPEGGYFATASDVARWMRTYMRGDLLSNETMQQALSFGVAPGLPATTYGLGAMKHIFDGHVGLGHGGDLAYSASSWYFPHRDLAISVLCNDANTNSWELLPVVEALLRKLESQLPASVVEVQASAETKILAYPNPFTNELTLSFDTKEAPSSIEICDAVGRVVYKDQALTYSTPNQVRLEEKCFGEHAGCYLVRLRWEEQISASVWVIKN